MLPVFVYGTLRPGSWNHASWLRPFLARPCEPDRLDGYELHLHAGLPSIVPAGNGAMVVGDLAFLDEQRYEEGLAHLDVLEGTATRHYDRIEVVTASGSRAWAWQAGPDLIRRLGPQSAVVHGDWHRLGLG